jgi:hypothetical protein
MITDSTNPDNKKKVLFFKDNVAFDCLIVEEFDTELLDSIKDNNGADMYFDITDIVGVGVDSCYINNKITAPKPVDNDYPHEWNESLNAWIVIKPEDTV